MGQAKILIFVKIVATLCCDAMRYKSAGVSGKSSLVKLWVCGLAPTLLFGCATTGSYEKVLQSWHGAHVDRLVSAWGPPYASYPLTDGGRVLEYTDQRTAQVGGFVYTTPQTTNESGSATVYGSKGSVRGKYSGTTTTYVQKQTPIYSVPLSCSTRFTVGSNGLITDWAWQGNNCRALPSNAETQMAAAATSGASDTASFVTDTQRLVGVGKTVELATEPFNLYREASRESDRLQRLYKKDNLVVEEISGDWLKVRTREGVQGWIMRNWVGSIL